MKMYNVNGLHFESKTEILKHINKIGACFNNSYVTGEDFSFMKEIFKHHPAKYPDIDKIYVAGTTKKKCTFFVEFQNRYLQVQRQAISFSKCIERLKTGEKPETIEKHTKFLVNPITLERIKVKPSIQSKPVPFGKYKGKSVDEMIKDKNYCLWLLKQSWFYKNNLYSILKVKFMI